MQLRKKVTSAGGIRLEIDDREVMRTLAEFPRQTNAGMNRALSSLGGAFGKKFSKERLTASGVQIRRKGIVKKRVKGQPSMPKKMALAGFKAALTGMAHLRGKRVTVSTASPVMIGHEEGHPRQAKNKLGFPIPFSKKKRVTPEERKNAVIIEGDKGPLLVVVRGSGKKKKVIPLIHFEQTIKGKRRLHFIKTWIRFEPEAIRRLDDALEAILKRVGKKGGANAGGP